MSIAAHTLGPGACLDLPSVAGSNFRRDSIIVVVGAGRGSVLTLPEPLAGIWIPLRGRLQFSGGECEYMLTRGDLRVAEPERRVRATGRGNALWIAVLGSRAAWRNTFAGSTVLPMLEPLLLPALHHAQRELRRQAVALARAACRGADRDAQAATDSVIDYVISMQNRFADVIARCPGRSYTQRRQVFLRLQRVRNYVRSNCHLDLDNDALARMANYSTWHFIRAFRAAYGETPHAHVIRERLERARHLLRTSPLAVAEVACASGFENRCAFSRLFRQRFGTTAGSVKRQFGEDQRSRARV